MVFYCDMLSLAVLGLRPGLEKNTEIILPLVTNEFHTIVHNILLHLKIMAAGLTRFRRKTSQSILC